MTLTYLRQQVPLSYAWRNKVGHVVTQSELDAMDEEDRQKYQWKADPNLVSELVQAERSETDRLFEGR